MSEFVFPEMTRPVSLTGNSCSLDCAHCNRHYLGGMLTLKELAGEKGVKSILASGGCNSDGEVPLCEHKKELSILKKKYRIVAHTGLLAPEKARELKGLLDVASFDFPPSTRAIKEVFGLNRTIEDYELSLKALHREVRVVPHLTIGLLGGKISGESEALERISSLELDTIVLNVLIPTKGTKYAGKSPPKLKDAISIIKESRDKFCNVYLGCMRPNGEYRKKLDERALPYVDRIVMPARGIARGGEPVFKECCAL